MTRMYLTAAAILCIFATACSGSSSGNPKVPAGAKSSGGKHATIVTDKGPIDIEFLENGAS